MKNVITKYDPESDLFDLIDKKSGEVLQSTIKPVCFRHRKPVESIMSATGFYCSKCSHRVDH